MTLSVKMIHMAKYEPFKNPSESLGLPQDSRAI